MTDPSTTLSIRKNKREVLRAPLHQMQSLVGRSPACDIVLRAPGVSPVHFLVERRNFETIDGATRSVWLLFDVAANLSAGEGVVLGEKAADLGGYEFAVIDDALAETPLRKDAFINSVIEQAEKQSLKMEHQGSSLNAIECVAYEHRSGAVTALAHIPLRPGDRKFRPAKRGPELTLEIPDRGRDWVNVIPRGGGQFRIKNRGIALDGFDVATGVRLQKSDFLEVDGDEYRFFLRYIHFEPPLIGRDARLARFSAAFVLGALTLVLLGLQIFVDSELVKPRIESVERVVHLTNPKPIEVTDVTDFPRDIAPPVKEEIAPVQEKATGPEWGNLLTQLKRVPSPSPSSRSGPTQSKSSSRAGRPRGGAGEVSASVVTPGTRLAPGVKASHVQPQGSAAQQLRLQTEHQGVRGVDVGQLPASRESSGGARVDTGDSGGDSRVQGGLAREQVQAVIRSHRAKITACYEIELVKNAGLKGALTLHWRINPDGSARSPRIQNTSSPLAKSSLAGCLLRVVASMRFPSHPSGIATEVTYPFFFAPF